MNQIFLDEEIVCDIKELIEENVQNLLVEVSQYAPQKLRDMEETIGQLQISTTDTSVRLKFIQQLKEFTKFPEIVLYFSNEYNAGTIPIYKKSTFKSIIKTIIRRFSPEENKISKNKLHHLTSALEPSEMVERVYLIIGKQLLKSLTPAEMVAVILHEIGHIYHTFSNLPDQILNTLKPLLRIVAWTKLFLQITHLTEISTQLTLLYSLVLMGLDHGITFTQRLDEYHSDNFAVKYGYGDELISALSKFKPQVVKQKSGIKKWIQEIWEVIKNIFLKIFIPNTHPTEENRIKNLENQIFNKYRQLYPEYKEIFYRVQVDYNNQLEAKA